MLIFLTGATGYVGSSVLEAFLRGGHDVTALVRDPEKAEFISSRGAHPVIGDLEKPSSYAAAAERSEVIVHTALDGSSRRDKIDRLAVDTFLAAATSRVASGNPAAFIYTSGVWVLGDTAAPVDEDAPVKPTPLVAWRPEHERLVLDAGRFRTPRTVVMRPGIVYGGNRGIIADLLKDSANGLVRVIGEGKNHWPCVYARDLADVYLRVATNPDASGVFHANDEADESVGDIVDSIARHARMRPDVRHVPLAEARAKMGAYADALALDQRVRSPRARALGWSPSLHSVAGNVARLLEEFRTRREAA
jgi:nucleoside-diphosphate-sugar epimerase